MLNFGSDPKVFHGGPYNPAIDPTIDNGAHWGSLAVQRWGVFNEGLGPHPLAHDGDAVVQFVRSETEKGTLQADVAAILRERLGWDGKPLTYLEASDLNRLTDPWTGKPWSVTINDVLAATAPTPVPPPVALPPTPDQGSELYESGHAISATLPRGSSIRRSVGAFETCWGGINAAIAQAVADRVPTFEQEWTVARAGLVKFYHALLGAYEDGRDYITGAEAIECQAACDQVWTTAHAARKAALGAKQDGWILVAGDPRQPVYKYSRHNRIIWTALTNLTTACGLYGLRGELLKNGMRDAWYVDPFENWDSQDPLRVEIGGGGGIGAGGNHFSDAIQ